MENSTKEAWKFEYTRADTQEVLSECIFMDATYSNRPDVVAKAVNRLLQDIFLNYKEVPFGRLKITKDKMNA